MTTFNLLDEPWLPAIDNQGQEVELSLLEVIGRAHGLRRLVGEIPTQEAALIRLILAILHRALPPLADRDDALEEWGR